MLSLSLGVASRHEFASGVSRGTKCDTDNTGASQPLDRKGVKGSKIIGGANPSGTYVMCENQLPILLPF